MSARDTAADPTYCPRCFQVVVQTTPFCPHCGQFIHANIGGDSSKWDTRPPAVPSAAAAEPIQQFVLPEDQFLSGRIEDRDREQRRQVTDKEPDGDTTATPETDSEST